MNCVARLGCIVAGLLIACSAAAKGGVLSVVSVDPPPRSMIAGVDTPVRVTFDQAVDRDSIVLGSSFMVFGRWSGPASGRIAFSDGDTALIFQPDWPFSAGETVMVGLSHDVRTPDGVRLRAAGYTWQFWTRAKTSLNIWDEVQVLDAGPEGHAQTYGGIATDLDGDHFLDITTVNEVTADLRVFMSRGDFTGLFNDYNRPTYPVNNRASPSEPADFNADGVPDICVANIDTSSVSILMGVGDGTFAPQQQVAVGSGPRGIAVLDADGDGDMDIVNTNSASSNLSLLINDGEGHFTRDSFFEGGCSGEWALAAADMDQDGVLDLVVGCRSSQQIRVLINNGDRTFTQAGIRPSDGGVWMIVLGDVDGNGTEDVAVVNGFSNRAAILMGDGKGGLSAPVRYATDPFCLATDLGDLDGDGDLDWLTSSFNGDWFVFTNNGQGVFQHTHTFAAPLAASCSLPLDVDNDGDLDLALIDERADLVFIETNAGTTIFKGDLTFDCKVTVSDYGYMASTCLTGPGVCAPPACGVFDFDDDCDVDARDYAALQAAFTGENRTIFGCLP